ncbi:MAG: YicC/YloC family endoribonuclease [Phenylobacterium sp.]
MAQISGMTGFGQSEGAGFGWTWAVEARSVNGRTLEVRYRGPAGFDTLERSAREAAQSRFQRGQVSVSVTARRVEAEVPVRINQALAKRLLDAGEPWIAEGRVLRPTLDGLLSLKGVIEAEPSEVDPEALAEITGRMTASVVEAIEDLRTSRLGEGRQLAEILGRMLDGVEGLVALAGQRAGEQVGAIRERFLRRLTELAGETPELAERAFLEAAALAVKADVREELDRLTGHVGSARGLLSDGGPVGRRLDFLTQEFMREANTLCSKAAIADLTRTGLDLKAAVDQFREQVQNVE